LYLQAKFNKYNQNLFTARYHHFKSKNEIAHIFLALHQYNIIFVN